MGKGSDVDRRTPGFSPGSGVVVYVVSSYPRLSETFVTNEVAALRRHGFEVRVIALSAGDTTTVDGPDLMLFADRRWRWRALADYAARHPRQLARLGLVIARQGLTYAGSFAKALPDLAEWLREQGPVLRIHTHFAWAGASVGMYVAAMTGSPLSMTVHARDIYVSPKHLQAKIDACRPLVTVCEYNRQWLLDHDYRAPDLAVVPCGVDAAPTPPLERSTSQIVGVGRLVPKKGFDLLIRALPQVRAKVPDLTVDLIGDGPERERLSLLAREIGVSDLIVLHGSRPHSEALELIDTGTVFVLPCRIDAEGDSDALPVVLREAMARGAAVVSTTVAGIPETVTPDAGWLVAPDDPDALAEAIISALTDHDERRRRVLAAHRRVLDHYTIDASAAALIDVWKRPVITG